MSDDKLITVSPEELIKELGDCVELKIAGGAVGPPGVGKTDIVIQLAKKLGYDLLITHPVCDDAIDYKGLPAIIDGPDGEKVGKFLPYGHLKDMINATKPLIVFIDDMGQALRLVQAAIMQLLWNRAINGVPVSEHVSFLWASNRAGDRAGADAGMLEPLKSRSYIFQVEADVNAWIKWAGKKESEGGGDMPPCLTAFMRFKPELLNDFTPTRDMVNSPNPRNWANLGKAFRYGMSKDGKKGGPMATAAKYAGAVGDGAAAVFSGFERTWGDLPDMKRVMLNPDSEPVPEKLEVLYALSGALSYYATPNNLDGLLKYVARMPQEFQVTTLKDMLVRTPKLSETKAVQNWIDDNVDVVF